MIRLLNEAANLLVSSGYLYTPYKANHEFPCISVNTLDKNEAQTSNLKSCTRELILRIHNRIAPSVQESASAKIGPYWSMIPRRTVISGHRNAARPLQETNHKTIMMDFYHSLLLVSTFTIQKLSSFINIYHKIIITVLYPVFSNSQ